MCTVCVSMSQTKGTKELCLLWCEAWLDQRTIWLVLKVPAINPQTLVLSRRAHFILVKDVSLVPYSTGTAGASSTWQSRTKSLRHSSAAVALIHCLSRETGPVGHIQGLSWVPPSRLHRSVFGGLNWKRENDVRGRYSVVKHNDPVLPPLSPQPFLSYITLLSACSFTFPCFLLLFCSL